MYAEQGCDDLVHKRSEVVILAEDITASIAPVRDMVNRTTPGCSGCSWHGRTFTVADIPVKYDVPVAMSLEHKGREAVFTVKWKTGDYMQSQLISPTGDRQLHVYLPIGAGMKYFTVLIMVAVVDLIFQACLLACLEGRVVSQARLHLWSNVLLLHILYVPVVFVAGLIAAINQKWASTALLVACAAGSYLICSWWAGGGWWAQVRRG